MNKKKSQKLPRKVKIPRSDSQGQSPHMEETCGTGTTDIKDQLRSKSVNFFCPPSSLLHCPSLHTTAPVTHLDALSTLNQHRLKGRTNQSVTGEHIGITIERSSKMLTFVTPLWYFPAATLLASAAPRQPTVNSNRRKSESVSAHHQNPQWLLFNTTTRWTGEGRRMEMTARQADKSTRVRVSWCPLTGCRNVEAFPAHCTNEEIAFDTSWHCKRVFIDRCKFRQIICF